MVGEISRLSGGRLTFLVTGMLGASALLLAACKSPTPPGEPPTLVELGEQVFLSETFNGNGRTCGTCHRPTDNFGLSPSFIATLPDNDPLFVAEFVPELAQNFESPRLMREFALILENQDGFDDLENNFNLRGVPHTLAMRNSIDSNTGPQTGWSGDGSPGDGSLRSFAIGAVIQHFTKTTNRIAGVDFRLPTDKELDALEAFQLSLGRQADLILPLPLKGTVAMRGQAIFLDNTLGKCNACHLNAGANGDPAIFGPGAGNLNFNTGVETLPDQPARLTGEKLPPDDGLGNPGSGEFNTPPLVEAADTGPFFHNNSVETIEGAVAFYNGDAFTNSPAGQLLVNATGSAINLDATQVVAVAAFLRVINALENIRSGLELLDRSLAQTNQTKNSANALLERALAENGDAVDVLIAGGLHPAAVTRLQLALESTRLALAAKKAKQRQQYANDAIAALNLARDHLTE